MPRAPKQIVVPDFLFFPEELSVLRERELPAHKRLHGIPVVTREPVTEDTPEVFEQERKASQEFIDNDEPLGDGLELKEEYSKQGSPIGVVARALESHGWYVTIIVSPIEVGWIFPSALICAVLITHARPVYRTSRFDAGLAARALQTTSAQAD
ncbi:hypothetical protein GALMADRAFT_145547 [Galerina marginata CBS 339.88]|uniref:ISWI HAND domain-containing protein n=1 Tax=Galerina marginata (strain CBS 339.88) TaxID=685588 RepID=A0A067SHP1_GALM3|nr:hypothetical protein GALMADRAFT_145547 [Galerina marginata CBS 339.88]